MISHKTRKTIVMVSPTHPLIALMQKHKFQHRGSQKKRVDCVEDSLSLSWRHLLTLSWLSCKTRQFQKVLVFAFNGDQQPQ